VLLGIVLEISENFALAFSKRHYPFPRLVFESGPNLAIHRTFAEFLR
jgi:hypothetical protein